MNNAELTLTPHPVSVSGQSSFTLPLVQAVNVLAYDTADLTLTILVLVATSAPTADVEIWTGMQNDSLDGWYKAANWAQQTAVAPGGLKLNVANMQKYIIWKITLGAGSGNPVCTFFIAGVLRQN